MSIVFCLTGEGKDITLPLAVIILRDQGIQLRKDDTGIADNMMVRGDILIDLRSVDIDMHDLGVTREGRWLQRYSVREAGADSDQKIAAVHSTVGSL